MAGDGTIEGVKKAATVGADKKAKLYEVIKALSAMRLCKEDNMPEETLTLLFSHIDPLYELHAAFLKDIEGRMATW